MTYLSIYCCEDTADPVLVHCELCLSPFHDRNTVSHICSQRNIFVRNQRSQKTYRETVSNSIFPAWGVLGFSKFVENASKLLEIQILDSREVFKYILFLLCPDASKGLLIQSGSVVMMIWIWYVDNEIKLCQLASRLLRRTVTGKLKKQNTLEIRNGFPNNNNTALSFWRKFDLFFFYLHR